MSEYLTRRPVAPALDRGLVHEDRKSNRPRGAGGAPTTTLAGVPEQEIVSALITVRERKTVREIAAFEIAAKCPFADAGVCRRSSGVMQSL